MADMAKRDMKNRVTKVDRLKLIDRLKKNKRKHVKEYEEAVAGYREASLRKLEEAHVKAKANLEKNYTELKAKLEKFDPAGEGAQDMGSHLVLVPTISINMSLPQSYEQEYEKAVSMMGWDTRDEVELTYAEFMCFVEDSWDWSDDFKAVSAFYKSVSFGG